MDYDVIIIGAGMSGLAAGIRLAQFDRRVCIVEKHYNFGGLNSFYRLNGRRFDVGLHALTNFVKPGIRNAPLPKFLRQLRIPREALDLCEQSYSSICFPDREIRFSNDVELLIGQVRAQFPAEIDNFLRLIEDVKPYDDLDLSATPAPHCTLLPDLLAARPPIPLPLCPCGLFKCVVVSP